MNEKNKISGIQLKVLVLEDSPHDLELVQELLVDAGYILDLTHVMNEADFSSALHENQFDIILTDFRLPGFDAFGALQIRNELWPDVPFICISGSIGEDTAIELLKLGAVDYVLKDRPERLPFAVKRALDEAKENLAFKMTSKQLHESKLRFEQVAEDAQEWIWEVDVDGMYTYASPVVHSLLGYTADEIVGKKYFYDFFVPEKKEELKAAAFEVFGSRATFRDFQNPNVHKNGHILMLTTSGSPMYDFAGNFVGYRGVDADVTEKVKILEELMLAKEKAEESDKLKTAFINNISHEIRTPLNSILGFSQFLSEKDLTNDQKKEYFNILEKSSNRLINTVSDFIDMARIVSGTMEVHQKNFQIQPFFLEIIENAKLSCEEKNICFKTDIPTEQKNLTIYSDPEFIGKTLRILLDNAMKFSSQGCITCGYKLSSDFVEFFVHDTGCGIAADKLEKIFEMFSQEDPSNTRGYEGSGLGLAIAQGMIKLIGGTIEVVSEKGNGSTFSFKIPFKVPTILESLSISNGTTKRDKPLVLIAEDEESNYMFLKVILNMIDCDFIHVTNGVEAVEACMKNEDITLVLMDIKMPLMNGLEATQRIHEFRPELPIIATTAYAQTGDEHRFLAAGCNGYLSKPISKDNLIQLIQKYTNISY
ncbi:MAG TPA: response regulator [Bacteroidales bacterium]|nr:response regulator [Bacteroidales bacterium]